MTTSGLDSDRSWRGLVGAGVVAGAVFLLLSALYARHLDWNSIRLAPACALVHGRPIYPSAEHGIITGHIYPPLSALAYAPVAWLRDISLMTALATVLAAAYYGLPFVLLGRMACRRWGVKPVDAAAVGLGVFFLSVLDPDLRLTAMLVHADDPGLGLAGLALLATLADEPGARRSMAAGFLGVAACLCKQTFVPAWLVLGVAAGQGGRRALGGFIGGSAAALALLAAALTLGRAWEPFYFNCWTIPAHHPLTTAHFQFAFGAPAPHQTLAAKLTTVALGGYSFLLTRWFWLAFVLWGAFRPMPGPLPPAGQAVRLASWIALAQLPVALVVSEKVGSGSNNLAPPLYFALVAAAAQLLRLLGPEAGGSVRRLLGCALLVLLVGNGPRTIFLTEAVLRRTDPNAAMIGFVRAHPRQVYLPWNPLVTWVAERRFDHFEYGVFDRALAQRPVSPPHFRRGLPPDLRWVAVRIGQPASAHDMFRHYLANLRPVASPPGLDGWTFYALDGPGQP